MMKEKWKDIRMFDKEFEVLKNRGLPTFEEVEEEKVAFYHAGMNASHSFSVGRLEDGRWAVRASCVEQSEDRLDALDAWYDKYPSPLASQEALARGEEYPYEPRDRTVVTVRILPPGEEPGYLGNRY